jgi:hypothetical protein
MYNFAIIRAFSLLLKDSLRIISETLRAGKKLSANSYLAAENLWKKVEISSRKKSCWVVKLIKIQNKEEVTWNFFINLSKYQEG